MLYWSQVAKGTLLPVERQLKQSVSILKNGGIIVYPTDTVYGLGADAFNEAAVNRIYKIKQRPLDQPLSVLIAEMSDLNQLTDDFPDMARILADKYWPGGLTLVVSKSSLIPDWITAGRDTVAVRIPDHPITLELLRAFGKPLIGTSANLSGSPSVISADEVKEQLGNAADFIFDGGVCPGGFESTIIDVTGNMPIVLREGAISRSELERAAVGL